MWPTGKCVVLWVAGRASVSRVMSPGTLGTWPDISRVGHVAPREACGGEAWVRMWGPHLGRKPASPGSHKRHLLGASPLFFAVVVPGRRDLRVYRHVGQFLPTQPHVSESHGGRGLLIAGCRCLVWVKGWRGHSPGERGHLGPERAPGKIPSPGPLGSRGFPRLLPCGLVLLTETRVRCRRMPFADTKDRRP